MLEFACWALALLVTIFAANTTRKQKATASRRSKTPGTGRIVSVVFHRRLDPADDIVTAPIGAVRVIRR